MIQQITRAVHGAELDRFAGPLVGAPANDDILKAAQAAYRSNQRIVDASTIALVNITKTGSLAAAVATLDGTNWSSGGVTEAVVDPIFASPDVTTAIAAAVPTIASYSVGAYSNALPNGEVGVIGFSRSLRGQKTRGVTVQIDLYKHVVRTDPGKNLQLGQWTKDPADLHDKIYGLYIKTTVDGIPVGLKILLDANLTAYGFVESAGALLSLPVSASPFGGTTANW